MTEIPRGCRRELVENLETREGQTLRMKAVVTDGYSFLIALWSAPVTIPASLVVSGIIVASHKDTVTTSQRVTVKALESCPLPTSAAIAIVLPSGATTQVVTAANGTGAFDVPADEPAQGRVTLRADGARPVEVAYYRTYAACAADRMTRVTDVSDLRTLPECHLVTTGGDLQIERAWDVSIAAATEAARGACGPVLDASAELQRLAPTVHAIVFARPEVASCVKVEGERQRALAACKTARAAAMHDAMAIKNLRKRGEALARLPRC